MRLVIDTDVFVSGIQSGAGASRVVLGAVLARVVVPLVSNSMLLEYEQVLKRPERLSASGLSHPEIDSLLEEMMRVAERVSVQSRRGPLVRDPGDQMFVDALIEGGADSVVSFNRRDYLPADEMLASRGVTVVPVAPPGEIVRRLRWQPTPPFPFAFPRR